MLIKATDAKGYQVLASDGELGSVSDLLFDDASWTVRWLVVETGTWLSERRVLLPVSALGHPDATTRTFPVKLTMAQVKDSPDVDTQRPVSRQFETGAYEYYGFRPYWNDELYLSGFGYWGGIAPLVTPQDAERREYELAQMLRAQDDPHLRSMAEVKGYHIHATDGEIGHLSDVMIEDSDWTLRYLIVDTSNWWQGEQVLISPRSAESIIWSERLINLRVDRDRVRHSPGYDRSQPLDPAFETKMATHYGSTPPADSA